MAKVGLWFCVLQYRLSLLARGANISTERSDQITLAAPSNKIIKAIKDVNRNAVCTAAPRYGGKQLIRHKLCVDTTDCLHEPLIKHHMLWSAFQT